MISAEFSLLGKNAIVAGEGGRWVRHVALALADAGANVAIAVRSNSEAKQLADEVRKIGHKAVALPTDLSSSAQVHKTVEQAVAQLGRVDILVNASDVPHAKPFLDIAEDEWRRVVDLNVMPAFFFSQAVGAHMLKQKKGRIISIASCLAERGLPNSSAYCVAMGGVLQLTRALSQEWARDGITVNAVGVGWFAERELVGMDGEDKLLRYLPLKRYGRPEEIGSMVVYLASDATDFVTGQFMVIDGAVMSHA